MKCLRSFILTMLMLGMLFSASAQEEKTFVFIIPGTENKYTQVLYEGFKTACTEMDIHVQLEAFDSETNPIHGIFERALAEGVDGIALSLRHSSQDTMQGFDLLEHTDMPFVTLGFTTNQEVLPSVKVGDPNIDLLSTAMLQSAVEIAGKNVQAAIITQFPPDIGYTHLQSMLYKLENDREQYAGFELVEVLACYDDAETAKVQTAYLLETYPDLEVIISTTTVGLVSAAEVVAQSGSNVKVTGLGVPSEMSEYILSGVCPQMFLWNPKDLGYLAAHTLHSMLDHEAWLGLRFNAGYLGEYAFEASETHAAEVRLESVLIFDKSNISIWNNTF